MLKNISTIGLCLCLAGLATSAAHGGTVVGRVLCDANNNNTNDTADLGMAGVMVVVVSEAGGFSNSTVTLPDGSFSLSLPDFDAAAYRRDPLSQSYIESLTPSTLPADAVVVVPQPALGTNPVYYITPQTTNSPIFYISLAGSSTNGDWLISSAACRGQSSQTNACRLTGSGRVLGESNRVDTFSGSISPKVKKNGFRQGNWTHVSKALNLRFKSTEIDAVVCEQGGGVSVVDTNGTANAIEFTGRGTLRSLRGKKKVSTSVFFTVWATDQGTPGAGKDSYYIRVYDQNNETLLLVSGDPANPENIVPLPISKGNLRIRSAGH
jgi:hypothetical protein